MKRTAGTLAFALAAVAASFAPTTTGCGTASHLYPANLFDRTRGCIFPVSSVDVVTGDDPGSTCAAVCLVSTTAEGGVHTLYVSDECAPYPPFYDTSGTDPDCARAFAAFKNGTACLDDGGVTGAPDAADAAETGPNDASSTGDSAVADAADAGTD